MEKQSQKVSSAKDEGFYHKTSSQVDTGSSKTFSLLHAKEGTRGGPNGGGVESSRPC